MTHQSDLSEGRLSLVPLTADTVTVSNISSHVNAGFDIWGRKKPQPVKVSVKLALSRSIFSAAASDKLDTSTVHYGHLSKNIATALADPKLNPDMATDETSIWESPLWLIQRISVAALATPIDKSAIAQIEADLLFAKATRFGDGVRLRTLGEPSNPVTATALALENLRIAALIGVNSHERSMTQLVIVSLTIHNANSAAVDAYFELEQLVVKTVEESSFETVESLSEEIAARCVKFFIFAKMNPHLESALYSRPVGLRVKVEKPSAVMIAEAPVIEIYRQCGPQDTYGKRMMAELGSKRPIVPFPLDGRLDEFLNSWKQD